MKTLSLALAFSLLGMVDQIHEQDVLVELSISKERLEYVHLPLWLFPCKIREGDVFQIVKTEGVLEFRCGNPPGEEE